MSSVQHGVPTHSAQSTGEPAWLRRTLIAIALLFVATFLILPLAAVFTEALRKGVSKPDQSLTDWMPMWSRWHWPGMWMRSVNKRS